MAAAAVRAIAGGDLGAEIATRPGDTDSLLAAMKRMQQDLRSMIWSLDTSAGRFHEAAGRMSSASVQVAESSSRQSDAAASIATADAISEISAALPEQSATSSDIAKHVEHIARISEENDLAARHTTAEAALELSALADQVQHAVRQFRL